ncbi:hypothetical protein D9619_004969 [Psilocybe cf. subviscida]|uniref:Nephrocystin 3-like N-terminal domain-containing protein n=1 Tax=Psilocybe cf. subviscida TaxID=2480587 RepID=A0A8H5F8N3_9AGAR|nr:hypothetical protein D9619_004969 [Psilocybe cf. subviscida]
MAEDNSQNRKDSNKKSFLNHLSKVFKRSAPPGPSDTSQGQGHPSRASKFFGKLKTTFPSKSTSSLPLAHSTENPGGGTILGKYCISSLCILNPNPVDHRPIAIPRSSHVRSISWITGAGYSLSGFRPAWPSEFSFSGFNQYHCDCSGCCNSAGIAGDSVEIEGNSAEKLAGVEGNSSRIEGNSDGVEGASAGIEGISAGVEGTSQSANPKGGSSLKENLKLTGRALQTFLPKVADIVDTNPVKVALDLVKTIIEIKNAVKDNKDMVARQIASTGGQLEEVVKALDGWKVVNKDQTLWMNHFSATLRDELQMLQELSNKSNFRKLLDHEDEQARIKDIFVRINEARVRFELALGLRVFKVVYDLDTAVKVLLRERLEPSRIAHHDYILEGEEGRMLRRQACTPGTRVRILDGIVRWAKNTSSDSPNVYWLFGHAGSGKSTIAYTIARRFEFAGDPNDTIILGGDFFCSRHFRQTRESKYIIRTIVHYLAHNCKPFSDALPSGDLDSIINRNHDFQLEHLLFGPWQKSEAARHADTSMPQHYLIVIDALDEIDGEGGSEFLRALVSAVNKINNKYLDGLKFFVTSRSDESLVNHVKQLQQKQLYHLQDVKPEEAYDDVATYLRASLPHFKGPEMDQLVDQAAGLFIYAATVVKEFT